MVPSHFAGSPSDTPGRDEVVLDQVSLEIRPGETAAIVGRVGSGKTTLLQTIPRLLEAPENTVFVDGFDIRTLPLRALRKRIGFVSRMSLSSPIPFPTMWLSEAMR